MNNLTQITQYSQPTMSSREIAELCNKRHDHVCRDIELLNETYAKMGLPKVGDTPYVHEQNGQTYREYQLTKEQCIDLITGYRADVRIRINRRWQELEQATPRLPRTHAEALRALADEVEAHECTKEALALAQPKADYFDGLIDQGLNLNIRTVAKELGLKQNTFVQWLLDKKYLYRDKRDTLMPYARHVSLFAIKEWATDTKAGTQTFITPKGRETFRLMAAKGKIDKPRSIE